MPPGSVARTGRQRVAQRKRSFHPSKRGRGVPPRVAARGRANARRTSFVRQLRWREPPGSVVFDDFALLGRALSGLAFSKTLTPTESARLRSESFCASPVSFGDDGALSSSIETFAPYLAALQPVRTRRKNRKEFFTFYAQLLYKDIK